MPKIEVTDNDFRRLQRYAEPLVDTATTAFTKVLDLLEGDSAHQYGRQDFALEGVRQPRLFAPGSVPPLTHTKVMAGAFGDAVPHRATWDGMVRLALETLFETTNDLKMVRGCSGANIVAGEKVDEGYKYLPDLGFSYQGVSAEDAVEIILRSARALNKNAWVNFVWRDKPEAHMPGEAGRIEI